MKDKDVYEKDSLSLAGAVAMGTGVMVGAAVFALTGQVAEFAGSLFPVAFLAAAVVSGFSAYTYVKMSNAYPSAGGIATYLEKAYGAHTVTGATALMMAVSMVINESLVARTFGSYTLQLFDVGSSSVWVPVLAVGLIVVAFLVNVAGNEVVGRVQKATAFLKIGGIVVFAVAALWAAGFSLPAAEGGAAGGSTAGGFLAGVALAILAYKGFTTITNSGAEVTDPHRNVGRAIVLSLSICLVVYLLVTLAVGASLTVPEIIAAKDYSLAEAARPALGQYGVWFTVGIAILATVSGLIASVFAVSRMLAMLTEMDIIPHSHFGMSGTVQRHTLVYTAVLASVLAAFFDLSRIASLGAVLYLVMDMVVHWGVFRHLRHEVGARGIVLLSALVLDAVVLAAFVRIKWAADPTIVLVALAAILVVFALERLFLRRHRRAEAGG